MSRKRNRKTRLYTEEEKRKIKARLEKVTGIKWKHFIASYYISEDGQLINANNNHLETPILLENGYRQYTICIDGKRVNYLVHRIVGYCFNDAVTPAMFCDSENWKCHHVNFIKSDSHYLNLCYLTKELHIKIHSDVKRGLIDKEDINTLDKLMLYIQEITEAA